MFPQLRIAGSGNGKNPTVALLSYTAQRLPRIRHLHLYICCPSRAIAVIIISSTQIREDLMMNNVTLLLPRAVLAKSKDAFGR